MLCRACKLSKTRRCIVAPRGPSPADAIFIVEAPTAADERLKQMGRTPQARLLAAMIADAAGMLGMEIPTYQIIPQVFCRPSKMPGDLDRAPERDEILACIPNVIAQVKRCDPAQIFFFGKEVSEYWKREYPEGKTLSPLWLLEKQGGQQSPHYTVNVRVIVEGFQNVVERYKGIDRAPGRAGHIVRGGGGHLDQ